MLHLYRKGTIVLKQRKSKNETLLRDKGSIMFYKKPYLYPTQ